jgi:putative PIG3 family NAD(P)H quinone oxidoreductase
MRYEAIEHRDGPLRRTWVEAPPLRPGEVRVEVVASGVNRADLMQRAGAYPAPPGASPILGLEAAGVVTETGPGVVDRQPGDRVAALLPGGGYARQVVVPAAHTVRLPEGVSFAEGAAFIEVFATAWLNLAREAGLAERAPGASVLLHAGGSGVGTAAIQVCGLLGHRVFITAGGADKVERCVALGAEAGWNRHDGPWAPSVAAWRPGGVDAILDPVGGSYFADNLGALAPDGALVLIGLLGGRMAEIDLGRLLIKRLRVVGSTLRSRSDAAKAALIAELAARVVPAWGPRLRPVVDRVFPVDAVEDAHRHMSGNLGFGCLVLDWGGAEG